MDSKIIEEYQEIEKELSSILFMVDAQGFWLKKKFYPRVFSIVSEDCFFTYEIDTGLSEKDFKGDDKYNLRYLTRFIHGLDLRPKRLQFGFCCHNQDTFKSYLVNMYESYKNQQKYAIGFKNSQLRPYLQSLELPLIDLENPRYKCPNLNFLDDYFGNKDYWFCGCHTNLPPIKAKQVGFRCALRKAAYLWRWSQNTIKDYNDILTESVSGELSKKNDSSRKNEIEVDSCDKIAEFCSI